MKNHIAWIYGGLLALVYSVVMFLLFKTKDYIYYATYGFTLVSILVATIISDIVLNKKKEKGNVIFLTRATYLTGLYLILQVGGGLYIYYKYMWLGLNFRIILFVLLIAIYIALSANAIFEYDNFNKIETKLADQKSFMFMVKNQIDYLKSIEALKDYRDEFNVLQNELEYSDPNSNKDSRIIEDKIKKEIFSLHDIDKKSNEEAEKLFSQIKSDIEYRNTILKKSK